MSAQTKKSLGEAIDAVVNALTGLDEPSKLIAIKAACEHMGVPLESARTPPPIPLATGTESHTPSTPHSFSATGTLMDIRSLKETKNPNNDIEMACVVAYYLKHSAPEDERRPEILTADIEKYFTQAGYPPPKVPGQVLRNAKAAGYMDKAGKSKFKLNPVGYNLVAHSLPRKTGKKF